MLTQLLLLAGGFGLLIKGADFLVDGASSIARRFGLSDLVIGLTIVSFGTSAPELAVNITSALSNNVDLALGNVIGSSIANILLILGTSAIIYPLVVQKGTVWKEIPFALMAAVAITILVNDVFLDYAPQSILSRIDGLILFLFFSIFLYYTYGISKVTGSTSQDTSKIHSTMFSALMVMGGLVGLVWGGQLIVTNATIIAVSLGATQALIGLTVVAIGTSLPELATSAVAAYKRKTDIAVGNVVGSNIFNIFFILATTAVITPLPFSEKMNTDMFVMIAASLLLFLAMFVGRKHKLERWQGVCFVSLYIAYIVTLILRG